MVIVGWNDDDVHFVPEHVQLSWIFVAKAHWNSSLLVNMLLFSDTLSWLIPNQSLLLFLNAAPLTEKQQMTNFIVFDFTWLGLKSTIHRTWGEHANHYIPSMQFSCIWRIGFVLKIFNWNNFSKVTCGRRKGSDFSWTLHGLLYYRSSSYPMDMLLLLFYGLRFQNKMTTIMHNAIWIEAIYS